MSLNELLQIGGGGLLLIAAVGVLVGNIYYVIRSKTSKLQKEQINQLQTDNEACNVRTAELQNSLKHLEGRVEELRNIPLLEIREGIKSIAKTNGKILDRLEGSSLTIKEDNK